MKRISPVVIVGILLTLAAEALYIYEPRFISSLCLAAYDGFMRQVAVYPKSGRVVLVDIDERSLREIGQWPWPRDIVARLTQRILDGGASVVAFDIVFAEPDGKSPAQVEQHQRRWYGVDARIDGIPAQLRDYDLTFARTLRAAKDRTLLGCFLHTTRDSVEGARGELPPCRDTVMPVGLDRGTAGGLSTLAANLLQASSATVSIPVLSAAAGNSAFFNAIPDDDNVVRRNPLVIAYGNERFFPSLAIEALRMDTRAPAVKVRYDTNGVSTVQVGRYTVPADSSGQMLINFRLPLPGTTNDGFRSFPSFSAALVLSNGWNNLAVSNKIVFIGTSAAGLKDLRATPLTPEFSGVEVHATMVDNILAEDTLAKPTQWVADCIDWTLILVVGVFLTFLIDRGRALLSFMVTVGVMVGSVVGCYFLFKEMRLVVIPVRLVSATMIIYPVLTMLRFLGEERQKYRIRKMFGTMVSPQVLRYLEKNPDSFSLAGQRAEATMFFSDVQNFTRISETLEPVKLSALLNGYLSPMTDIIMRRQGYVDKYEGDLIMAEWGVPFPLQGHAEQACLAALEQSAKLAELRPELKRQFGHDIHVRMGINSGSVTAGNMGTTDRQQFTVMGDAVNLARRFEPVNKDYGTEIIIGESTYEGARGVVVARLLDRIVVAGKSEPVCICELLGRKGEVPEIRLNVAQLYESALRLHWEREWKAALECLERALGLDSSDGPSILLQKRILGFMSTPPGRGWKGEFVRLEKD